MEEKGASCLLTPDSANTKDMNLMKLFAKEIRRNLAKVISLVVFPGNEFLREIRG